MIELKPNYKLFQRYIRRWTDLHMPREMKLYFNRVGGPAANAYRGQIAKGPPHTISKGKRTQGGNLRKSVRYKVFDRQTKVGSLPVVGIAVAPMGRLGAHRALVEYGHTTQGGTRVSGHPYAAAAREAAATRLQAGIDRAVQAAINAAEAG